MKQPVDPFEIIKGNPTLIEHLKAECRRVKLQRNNYEEKLRLANRRINELEVKLKEQTKNHYTTRFYDEKGNEIKIAGSDLDKVINRAETNKDRL